MTQPKSKLKEIIGREIRKSFYASGTADTAETYRVLCEDHDEAIQAELAEDAKRGLMRRIEQCLKAYLKPPAEDEDDGQLELPGLPPKLKEQIDEVIAVPRPNGTCSYLYVRHPKTTVRKVVEHIEFLRGHRGAIDLKMGAWRELVQRCGRVDLDTSLVQALRDAEQKRGKGSSRRSPKPPGAPGDHPGGPL